MNVKHTSYVLHVLVAVLGMSMEWWLDIFRFFIEALWIEENISSQLFSADVNKVEAVNNLTI